MSCVRERAGYSIAGGGQSLRFRTMTGEAATATVKKRVPCNKHIDSHSDRQRRQRRWLQVFIRLDLEICDRFHSGLFLRLVFGMLAALGMRGIERAHERDEKQCCRGKLSWPVSYHRGAPVFGSE